MLKHLVPGRLPDVHGRRTIEVLRADLLLRLPLHPVLRQAHHDRLSSRGPRPWPPASPAARPPQPAVPAAEPSRPGDRESPHSRHSAASRSPAAADRSRRAIAAACNSAPTLTIAPEPGVTPRDGFRFRGISSGRLKSASSRPRARPGWTTTRSAPGAPSTATPCCPCAPRRCSPLPPPAPHRPAPANRPPPADPACAARSVGLHRETTRHRGRRPPWRRARPGQGQRPRSPPPRPPGHRAHDRRRPPTRLRLVTMAPPPPGPRPMAPLPRPAQIRQL